MPVTRHCKRCGKNWVQREKRVPADQKPVQCPKCKSLYWDEDREPVGGEKKAPKRAEAPFHIYISDPVADHAHTSNMGQWLSEKFNRAVSGGHA